MEAMKVEQKRNTLVTDNFIMEFVGEYIEQRNTTVIFKEVYLKKTNLHVSSTIKGFYFGAPDDQWTCAPIFHGELTCNYYLGG